ncbi:MAG: TraR/DksA family transcriptional regulator [Nitrospirota bacterium]
MNGSEIEQCRQKLLSLRAELLDFEGSSREATRPVELDQTGMGCLSRRDYMQAQQLAEEGPRLRKRQLQKIDGALRRIETGAYGQCFACEEELDARGLLVDPTTTRCENCVEE